ncbi:MAG: CCA tRNA nucleotidyltransferase [Chloroflexota bacterium]
MAHVPLPRRAPGASGDRQLSPPAGAGGEPYALPHPLPGSVVGVLTTLAAAGHDAVLVGGAVRDLLRGAPPTDWDVATSASPDEVALRFPASTWLNRFGTVTVRGDPAVQVTSYRSEAGYADRRRPDAVRFGVTLADDLARRDFTINAIAWRPSDAARGLGELIDPHGGRADLAADVLRAVGDPAARFEEDALRLLRAVRLAARFGLRLDPATDAALRAHAHAAAAVSGERVRDELLRVLGDPDHLPSSALRTMEATGLLAVLLPELAALRGVPQGKPLPGDALDHALRTVDALAATDTSLRLAGLLHDVGKATTLAHGHFIGHEEVGAELAARILERLRIPGEATARIGHLIRQHMFAYAPDWTDAAVRRFVRRIGLDALDDLFALRAADNAASGVVEPVQGGLDELRARIASVASGAALQTYQLAIDGDDLQVELGLAPSPEIGRILAGLLEAIIDEPALNARARLLDLARKLAAEG